MARPRLVGFQSSEPIYIGQLIVNFLRAVERFRSQYERFGDPRNQSSAESLAYAALAEALAWADSIDNFLREGPKNNRGTQRNREWASALADDQRKLIDAFRRVRNLVHHRWWRALAIRFERDEAGGQVNRWVWGDLPQGAGQGRGRAVELDKSYSDRLRGADVLTSLDELAAVLWIKRDRYLARMDIDQPGHAVGSPLTFDDEAAPRGNGGG